jgi:hypothetical protein
MISVFQVSLRYFFQVALYLSVVVRMAKPPEEVLGEVFDHEIKIQG